MNDVTTAEDLGQHLRRERVRSGLTQAELARRAGVASTTVANVERGRTVPLRAVRRSLEAALARTRRR